MATQAPQTASQPSPTHPDLVLDVDYAPGPPRCSLDAFGDLDVASVDLLERTVTCVATIGRTEVTLNMAGVDFCDVVSLNRLLAIQQDLRTRGGRLTVVNPCWSLRRMAELFRLDDALGLAA